MSHLKSSKEDQSVMHAAAASFPSPPHFEQEQIETAKDTEVEQNNQEIDTYTTTRASALDTPQDMLVR
jgi:hypothetical protein